MADIMDLILADHERILRLQTALRDVARYHGDAGSEWALGSTWDRLATLIEIHIEAEEEICYLAMFHTSRAGQAQIQEALADHDDIREALGEARLQPIGSAAWWRAVKDVLSTWVDQTDSEEQGVLADFARQADRGQREDLGRQWSAFTTARRRDLLSQAQPDDATCPMCQWPIPGRHPHIIDANRCAILCTCPACYVLFHQAKTARNNPGGAGLGMRAARQRPVRARHPHI